MGTELFSLYVLQLRLEHRGNADPSTFYPQRRKFPTLTWSGPSRVMWTTGTQTWSQGDQEATEGLSESPEPPPLGPAYS